MTLDPKQYKPFRCEVMNKQFKSVFGSEQPVIKDRYQDIANRIMKGPAKRPSECKEVLG